jgi:hypothetical protein
LSSASRSARYTTHDDQLPLPVGGTGLTPSTTARLSRSAKRCTISTASSRLWAA